MKVGDMVYFAEQPKCYFRVQATSERYAVMNRPHFGTTLYTVIDHEKQWRGPEDLIFGPGAETRKQCEQMLERLARGTSEVSRRRGIPLNVLKVTAQPGQEPKESA